MPASQPISICSLGTITQVCGGGIVSSLPVASAFIWPLGSQEPQQEGGDCPESTGLGVRRKVARLCCYIAV